jgi:cell wall-associated NlpC family hydrolase
MNLFIKILFLLLSISLFSISKEEYYEIRDAMFDRHGLLLLKNNGDSIELYQQVLKWEGVPYKMGERSKEGIGTIELVSEFYDKLFSITITGTPKSLVHKIKIKSKLLSPDQGDVLLFRFDENNVNHVGIYLKDKLFIHSTVKKGVVVESLDDPFYQENLFGFGKPNNCDD